MKKLGMIYLGIVIFLFVLGCGSTNLCSYVVEPPKDVFVGAAYFKISTLRLYNEHLYDSDGIEYGYISITDGNPYVKYDGKKVWFMYVDEQLCPTKLVKRYIIQIIEEPEKYERPIESTSRLHLVDDLVKSKLQQQFFVTRPCSPGG